MAFSKFPLILSYFQINEKGFLQDFSHPAHCFFNLGAIARGSSTFAEEYGKRAKIIVETLTGDVGITFCGREKEAA